MNAAVKLLSGLALATSLIGTNVIAQTVPAGPVEVGVVEMTLQVVPRVVTLPGRAEVATVSIGDLVTAGQGDALTTRFDPTRYMSICWRPAHGCWPFARQSKKAP
ncbi:hypothetical protein OO012_14225 [Rhodobacteraceae bacterium KMM 6894]|nr:hypothetical protein [Rhodobacteraceae bacterium KMM 6894]